MKINSINFDKKIERKIFFIAAAAGVAAYTVFKSFPFKFFSSKNQGKISNPKNDMIKVNPMAVSRKNTGGRNV